MLRETRRITTFNNIGNAKKVIESSATTLGELQQDLSRNGISYQGMKLVTGETQVTLESTQSILPEGDFILFMVPEKVKSGYTSDDDFVDEQNGIAWDDEDWNHPQAMVEEAYFKSRKDLAIARAKKAQYYLGKVIEFMASEEASSFEDDPEVKSLSEAAERIKANLNLF